MKYLFIIIFGLSVFAAYSQKNNNNFIKIKYSYTVENVQSETQLQKLSEDLKNIKGVDNVKYTYKPEKQKAQFIIYTTHKIRQSEADEEFRITDLKAAVLKNELTPSYFKEEIVKQ